MSQTVHKPDPWRKAVLFAQTVRLEQTLLALPFAYAALFQASGGLPTARDFLWVNLAMVGARTFGMAANRYIDAEIDARNPRTARRPMPAGMLGHREMLVSMAMAIGVFLFAVWHLSPWTHLLWPVVLAAMTVYPYMKRFTWLCHFGVSAIYVMVPTGVWIAVTDSLEPGAMFLGLAAGCWAGGFDIIYQSQDYEHDRASGLNSIPARFGPARALLAARVLHASAAILLAAAGVALGGGPLYFIGVAVFIALVIYEHRLVSPKDLSKANVAFFNMNGIISVTFFAFAALDSLVRA
jgi:4-hydroxybenzoate polyprenyltransferase